MPEKTGKSSSRPPSLSQDGLVDDLRPSPADPAPDVIELYGFLGRDTADGYWRLYLNTRLDAYLRIAETDIVASPQPGPDATPLDPSCVFIRASATVEGVKSIPLKTEASFLQGAYTAGLIAAAHSSAVVAEATNLRPRRHRRDPSTREDYPETYPYFCPPQTTIEHHTCFCTVFCEM